MSENIFKNRLDKIEAQGNWDLGISETEAASYRNQLVPEDYSVTDWEEDEVVLSSFELLTDYLAENQSIARYAVDQATTGQTENPAEYMRDLTSRIAAPISLANSLKDAPEDIKEAYRTMKSRWDKASITGAGEFAGAAVDYASDIAFSPEGLATIGGLLSGVPTMGVGTAVTAAARKTAQVAGQNALTKAVKSSYAVSAKNPLTATTLVGAGHGLVYSHILQELDISADIKSEEDYNYLETLGGGVLGAGIGFGLSKGIGLYTNSKIGNKAFRESTEPQKELSIPDGARAFDDALEGEWMPASGGSIIEEAMRLDGNRITKTVDGTDNASARSTSDDAMDAAAQKFADDLGGGEKTKKEILARIRAASDNETTVEGKTNAFKQAVFTVAADISGNFYGKAAGVLSPITKFSGTAAQLQKKLSHEFGITADLLTPQQKVVEKDLSEVQREVTGKINERFRAIVETLSISEIDTKFAVDINAALSKNLRSKKPIKYDAFDDATNSAIIKASAEIKGLYNEMGIDLSKIKVIDKLTEDYVPRMWSRSAIEKNQDELVSLFQTEAKMSKAQAKATVKSMLDVKNQVDGGGGGGGHFFSAKRKINTIGDDSKFEKFLNNDVLGTLHAYTFQYGKSVAKHRVLGVKDFNEFKGFYVNRIKEEMEEAGQTFTPKIQAQIEKLYRTATGEGMERYGAKTQLAVDAYSFTNRVALLGLATVSSLTEVFLNISKAGVKNSLKGFGEAMEQSHKRITKDLESELMTKNGMTAKEALSEMRNFSIHVDQALAQVGDRLAGDELMTVGLQNASNKFFRANLLDQWTKFVQNVSHSSGKSLINENIEKLAVRYKNRALDSDGEVLAGELRELDIDSEKAVAWYNSGAKRTDEFYKNDFLGGVARYTNSVVLQPTAMSGLRPLLFSNPKTAVFFQLLSYPAAFTNTVLKGAVKSLIKAPKRNSGKIAVAGLMMTGMARWTNYVRTGGESERGKDTSEILAASIARWGGNGLLLDSFQRAQKATKYTKSNLSYAAMPFGPAISDSISLIQQGIIPTVGYKVPLLSGSYFGKQVLGEPTVRRYRQGLREAQTDVFGGLIEEFDETPKAMKFNIGGVVGKAVPAITNLFKKGGDDLLENSLPVSLAGDVNGTLTTSTRGLIKPEFIQDTTSKIEGSLSLRLSQGDVGLDEISSVELAEANISTMFNSKIGSLDDAEKSVNFQKALKESNPVKAKEALTDYQKELGYTDDQIFAFKIIEDIEDVSDSKNIIKGDIAEDIKELQKVYNDINIKVTASDRAKAETAKFDEDSLDATHDFLTVIIKDTQPLISDEGAPIVARDAIIKIAAKGNVNFSKFKAPKLKAIDKPNASLTDAEREKALAKHIENSVEKVKIYRTIKTFKDSEFNVSFPFAREIGTHVGTKGVAQTIKMRDAVFDVYDGEKAGNVYMSFKNKKPQEDEFVSQFNMLEKVAQVNKRKIGEVEMQEGYVNVTNPLMYKGETAVNTWSADKILADLEGVNELLVNIEESGGSITKSTITNLKALHKRALELGVEPRETIVETLEHELMKNELTIDLRTELQGLGFDAIKYVNEIEHGFKGESEFSYILFEPQQFKLTTSAAFDSTDPRQAYAIGSLVRGVQKAFAPKKVSGLFSEAEKAAQQLQGSKPRAGQSFLNEMKNVTPDELEWTGANARFGNNKPVTKEEVQGFFEENDFDFEVQVGRSRPEEIEAVDDMPTLSGSEDEEVALFENWLADNKPFERDMMDDLLDEDPDAWDEMYDDLIGEWRENTGGMGDFATQQAHLDYSFEGRDTKNYRELVISIPDKYKKVKADYENMVHHPDSKNQIAHVRLADIEQTDDAFNKTLLIDEIQSDAHQTATGKEGKGYATLADEQKLKEMITQARESNRVNGYSDKMNALDNIEDKIDQLDDMIDDNIISEEEYFRRKNELEVEIQEISTRPVDAEAQELEEKVIDFSMELEDKVPDLPLRKDKQWGAAGLRQAMKVAAEEGYDQVALTTGRLQAERNRKIGDINEAIFYKNPSENSTGWSVQGIRNEDEGMGDFLISFDSYEEGVERLPKIIGKENTEKLLATTPDDLGDYALKQPMTFKQGGKKYADFYDGTLQKIWKRDFAKKYNVDIKMVEYKQGNKTVKLPTLEMTDKMREDIKLGLKMFAEGGYVDDGNTKTCKSVAVLKKTIAKGKI